MTRDMRFAAGGAGVGATLLAVGLLCAPSPFTVGDAFFQAVGLVGGMSAIFVVLGRFT